MNPIFYLDTDENNQMSKIVYNSSGHVSSRAETQSKMEPKRMDPVSDEKNSKQEKISEQNPKGLSNIILPLCIHSALRGFYIKLWNHSIRPSQDMHASGILFNEILNLMVHIPPAI